MSAAVSMPVAIVSASAMMRFLACFKKGKMSY